MKTLYKFTYQAKNLSKEILMFNFFVSHHNIKEAQEIVYNKLRAMLDQKYNNNSLPENNINLIDCNLITIEILANDGNENTTQNFLI